MGLNNAADRSLKELVSRREDAWIENRRHVHARPEMGWLEFYTSFGVRRALSRLPFRIHCGQEIMASEFLMGLPSEAETKTAWERALAWGVEGDMPLPGGTAVMAVLDTGRPGPVTAFRFDLDALRLVESDEMSHVPFRKGFASQVTGTMHACGHDGHVAIGLGLSEAVAALSQTGLLSGEIRIVFQPAEEGARGGLAVARSGVFDDVDHLVCCHIGVKAPDLGQFVGGAVGMLASVKLRVVFTGQAAHAGLQPEMGRNALLGAATATLNLHALAQSSRPGTRINVGSLCAGDSANVVPERAEFLMEFRADTDEETTELEKRVRRVISASAEMHGLGLQVEITGKTAAADSSPKLAQLAVQEARRMGFWDDMAENSPFGASEDASWLMRKVQNRGGLATYILLGGGLKGGHHQPTFDIDEQVITRGVLLLAGMVARLNPGDDRP